MSDLYSVAQAHKMALLVKERAIATRMVGAYGVAWLSIKARLDALLEEIEAARERGETVSASWLARQSRLEALLRQVEGEIRDFARFAEPLIVSEQREAVAAAQRNAPVEVDAALGKRPPQVRGLVNFNRVPTAALEDLVGFLSDGSPLRSLLDELPGNASRNVQEKLIAGVAQGRNPRLIASEIRKDLGGNLTRALTVSRTEVIRPYRESSRRSYEANRDVVEQWAWNAALDQRTCAACIAMHGTLHVLSESLESHPVCRCQMVPRTKSWAELLGDSSIPDTRPKVINGAEWFARQSKDVQAAILGKRAQEAYAAGDVDLMDFVGEKHSERWGRSRYVRSLADAMAA